VGIISWISKHIKNPNSQNTSPSKKICNFDQRQEIEAAYDYRKRGIRCVLLDQIIGSVGRYHDFDRQFKLKPHLPSERFEQIKNAMLDGKPMPPVKLYQIKEDYYVLDGNHRIAAARALGRKDISAEIVELIPSKNSLENILYLERSEFEDKTGISPRIILTEIGQYEYLIKQIESHRIYLLNQGSEALSFEQAAQDWYNTIYCPMITLIEKARLMESFPDRTSADLFTYIAFHQWELGRTRKYGFGIDNLIPNDMEEFRTKMANITTGDYPDMQRWITTFVLMNVTAKHERKIMEKLFAIEEVKEVHSVHGAFDIIVKIVLSRDLLCSDAEVIGDFVQNKIRMINGVTTTQTLIPGLSRIK
jgi:DNA-binding Lrp family transcriptional regulator